MSELSYNETSIDELEQIGAVRLRPQSIGFESESHLYVEQLANSIDEAREGYGSLIETTKHKDNSISVRDYGRSIPLDFNSKTKKYNWSSIFTRMWGGGKYSNNNTDSNYKQSLGTNGAGNFGTCATSEFLEVWSYKGTECHNIKFKKGEIAKEFNKYKDESDRGTKIHFKPDFEVYGQNIIEDDFIESTLKRQAIVNGGIKFIYTNEITCETKEFYYENGIKDYIMEISQDKEISQIYSLEGETFIESKPQDFHAKYEIKFLFNNECNLMEYYHNSSYLPNGGLPEKVIKNAMIYMFDKHLKSNKLYKKNEKLKFEDIQDSLIIVFSSGSTTSIFSDQTKKSIEHKKLQEVITNDFKDYLEVIFTENKPEFGKIFNQCLINMRARTKSEKIKLNEKKKTRIGLEDKVLKLTDCISDNPEECEVYLVEGDSAGGTAKLSRNRMTQAVLAQRGKCTNVEKSKKNTKKPEDLKNIDNTLCCGTKNKYDKNKLKYHKVICLADADSDGAGHITILWLTYMYREYNQLIKDGFLYIAIPPLYKNVMGVKNKNEVVEYTYTEEEQQVFLKKNTPKSIQRYKGIGEMSAEQLEDTVMNKNSRRLIQVTIADACKAEETVINLMGDKAAPRYEFIMNNIKFGGDK